MEMRQMKGMEIARMGKIQKMKEGYRVPSQTEKGGFYQVSDEDFTCTCPDSQKRKQTCKHAFALRYYLKTE